METQKQNQTDDLRECTDLFVKHLDFIYDGEDFFRYNDNIGLWGNVHDNEIESPHKEEAEIQYAQKIKDLNALISGSKGWRWTPKVGPPEGRVKL